MKKTTLSLLTATLLLSPAFAVEDLGEIIVTSTNKLPQKVKNSTANVTVITAEDIEERGYQSVAEVLSHTTGFSTNTSGGAGQYTGIFLRGLDGSFVKVLVDGVAQTDYTQPSTASAIEHISIENIERIEIVKGAQSGVWGADAVTGVINIITKSASTDYAKIKLKAGSHATYGIGAEISKNGEWGSFYLSGSSLDTDSISALSPSDAENDSYSQKEFHLKTSLNIDLHNSITLALHNNTSKFDYDTGFAEDNNSKGESKSSTIALGYQYKNEALMVDFKASKHAIDRSYESPYGPFDTTADSDSISLTGRYDFGIHGTLVAGLEHTKNSGKTTYMAENTFKNNAIFISYDKNLGSLLGAKTTVNATLRYDNFDKFDNKTTYRFGIKRECEAIEGLYTATNLYSAYKAPSITQFSNPSGTLTPESIEGYEMTVGYKKYITATYFRNKIKDKIIAEGFFPNTTYKNSGDGVTVNGIELASEYAFENGFIIGANFTHMIDFIDDSGKDALRVPQNSGSIYLDYYFGAESYVGVIANYVGKRRDFTLDPVTWTSTDVTLESYTTVDVTYKTKFSQDLSVSVTAKNIFDKEYETVKGYSAEGRSIYATIEYKF